MKNNKKKLITSAFFATVLVASGNSAFANESGDNNKIVITEEKSLNGTVLEKNNKKYLVLTAKNDVNNVSINVKVDDSNYNFKENKIKAGEVKEIELPEIQLKENIKKLPKTSSYRENITFKKVIKNYEFIVNISYDVLKEQSKVETPKEDEKPDVEVPKEEQPKVEIPKEVEPKEQPKVEVPKEVEPKEQPKVETPKEVEPKEQPKVETPKEVEPKEQPKVETPKEVEPKEQPKVEVPKEVESKEQPKVEVPKEVESKEQPKVEAPKEVEPKEQPKVNNNTYVKYYSQNDYRWGNKVYGLGNLANTGCVPASLSMIVSTYTGQDVSVTEIADNLYYNTNYFNKRTIGTYAEGVSYISSYYGLKTKALGNIEELRNELINGNIVYAAVDNQPFTINGYSHAVVLRGIDENGNVTVYNPYTSFGTVRKFNINKIWQHKSKDPDNLGLGSPFISIYK